MNPEAKVKIQRMFPGLVRLAAEERRVQFRDHGCLTYGELQRWKRFRVKLKSVRGKIRSVEWKALVMQALHAFYGFPSERFVEHMGMIRQAFLDVEHDLNCLLRELPHEFRETVRGPEVVRECTDFLDLVELFRFGAPGSDSAERKRVREHARIKLVLGQFYFDQRRKKRDVVSLQAQADRLRVRVEEYVFQRSTGTSVWILANLEPQLPHACESWLELAHDAKPESLGPHQVLIPARRYTVEIGQGKVPVYFFVRAKDHLALKALKVGTRFLEQRGVADLIGMMFIVRDGDKRVFIDYLRDRLVYCPGVVCDQVSSDYAEIKHVMEMMDIVFELQILTGNQYVNNKYRRDQNNHAAFKLRHHAENVLPLLAPDLPWDDPEFVDRLVRHRLTHLDQGW